MLVLSKSKTETSVDKRNKRRKNPNVASLLDMEAVPGLLAVLATQLCLMTLHVVSSANQGKQTLSDNAFANSEAKACASKRNWWLARIHKTTLTFSSTSYLLV